MSSPEFAGWGSSLGAATAQRPAQDEALDGAKLRICFVSHYALGALVDNSVRHTLGGIERQQSVMARWLAARGHDVSMVTWDEGQGDQENVNGVRVLGFARLDAGLPGLRFVHPRWTGLWRALSRANADLYYYNLGDATLGQVVLWCRVNNRKCVYSVPIDSACMRDLPKLRARRQRVLYRYGLRHADRVIVQTRRQESMLLENFGLRSDSLPMPCVDESPTPGCETVSPPSAKPGVLWVGRFAEQKHLEWLLDLAERSPDLCFDVAGGSHESSPYADAMIARAQTLPNVVLHGQVPHASLVALYRSAVCLLCTSRVEGFPNTFLEAWSHGLPVVSTFDPDDIIARMGLGGTAADVDGLNREVRRLVDSSEERARASAAARGYYETNHMLDPCMQRFERFFREAMRGDFQSPGPA